VELKPNTGNTEAFLKAEYDRYAKLPDAHRKIITDEHGLFEYAYGKTMQIDRYLVENDENLALEDASSMFSFFSLSADKAHEREEHVDAKLKAMQAQYNKSAKRVTDGKAEIIAKEEYQKLQMMLFRFRRIRRCCESMAESMRLRLESARSKNANSRTGLAGSYRTNQ